LRRPHPAARSSTFDALSGTRDRTFDRQMSKRLFVGNLNYDTTEDDLIEAFEQDGRKVVSARVMTDRDTGRSRGFAFVEMETEEDAQAAITAMNGAEIAGRALRVNEAEARAPRGGGGGGGGRGGFGGGGRGGFGGGGGGGGRGGFGGGRGGRGRERDQRDRW
jgi:RNA recognition motif-containing protein